MIDNRTTLLLVDGSALGYTVKLADNSFSQLNDLTGLFQGADRVDYIDTFMLMNVPGTNRFISTLSNSILFDPTYVAAKTDYPDDLMSLIVNRHELLLIGALKSEIWYDAGLPQFPFAELPGAYIEHGTCARYSIASQDISTYWLGQDLQGQGVVFRQRGYECKRVSTHAIEYAIQQILAQGLPIADAIGYIYQQGGHVFYVLSFPSGDQTWVYDEASELWHQRAFTDQQGRLRRDRGNCAAFLYGQNVVGDFENGTLYALDPGVFQDSVLDPQYGAYTARPISWIRTFPHIGAAVNDQGQPVLADGKRVKFSQFIADIESGMVALDENGARPQLSLRWSDDRGRTYGNVVLQINGQTGEYLTSPSWRGLGIARDRVFELSYSFNGPAALNGAWVEAQVSNT